MVEAAHGMNVEPMTTLFTVADLSRLWAVGKFYEDDQSFLKRGQTATVRLSDGRVLQGKVDYVLPTVEEMTRTVDARIVLDNAKGDLRAGQSVDVEVVADLGSFVAIPSDAVLRTGSRAIAFVSLGGDGLFEPRELGLGPEGDGYVAVERGIEPAERAVLGAKFFVDSES